MRNIFKLASCLTPLCVALAACSGSPSSEAPKAPQFAAHLYVLDDVSISSGVQGDDAVGKAVRARIGEAVKKLALGDSSTIVEVGSLSAERFVKHPTITTNAQLRQTAASRKVVTQLEEIAARHRASDGDGGSHLLMALTNLQPDCRSGRSVIKIVSDGLEESFGYSATSAISSGKSLELPPPPTAFLKGCKVEFLGFGMTAYGAGTSIVLPEVQLRFLRDGWAKWLSAAGVAPSDMVFTSLL
jgi:hypothetical protein